jgi:hypothetical protein
VLTKASDWLRSSNFENAKGWGSLGPITGRKDTRPASPEHRPENLTGLAWNST